MTITTQQGLSTEDQIKLLRESYRRRDNKDGSNIGNKEGTIASNIGKSTTKTPPESGDSKTDSGFPPSNILEPVSWAVSGILGTPIPSKIDTPKLDINLDEVYSTTLDPDLLKQSVSKVEVSIPELKNPHSNLELRYLRNSKNKGPNGKFLLKFVDDITNRIYYWDGEKTKDGKIALYNISNNDEGKQFYKKYPHPVIIKGIIY